jgi:acyl-CoA thioesterase-1
MSHVIDYFLIAPSRRRLASALGLLLGVTLTLGGCNPHSAEDSAPARSPSSRGGERRAAEASTATAASTAAPTRSRPRIVILGDSLTSGYGLDPTQSFPSQLQQRLDASGFQYEVVNMGVTGDTSAGGLRRLEWALEGDVRVLVVALGGNDGLRGLDPQELERNLEAIVDKARARNLLVVLCGMEAPPNFGESYTRAFREVYRRVAREKDVALLPFLLEGVAGDPSLNQPDGIHPTAEGARRVADLVWTTLEPALGAR